MATARTFEDLWIWQTARGLVKDVYSDFGSESPAARDFAFLDQIRRAAMSIMNNIAEGFERGSDPDFANFLRIAKGSAGEVRSMFYTAEDLGYAALAHAVERREKLKQLNAGIESLRIHLRT
jgi:four helix bundle protein